MRLKPFIALQAFYAFHGNNAGVQFANSADCEIITFGNEISLGSDGWAHLAPFGDFPGKGVIKKPDGQIEEFAAVQRFDRPAAEAMVSRFNSAVQRAKRYVTGCFIYDGHPDALNAGDKYPDKNPKGMIADLAVREDGLYCKPVFSNEGQAILKKRKLCFSALWSCPKKPVGEEQGKKIYRPDDLKSAALTEYPNLPVHFVNSATPKEKQNKTDPMKELLIKLLASFGVQFANDAEDQKLLDAVKSLGEKAKTADTLTTEKTEWANERTRINGIVTARDSAITQLTGERDTLRVNFANERKSRIGGLIETAITDGRITAAERADWERRLGNETEFANESEALRKVGVKVKTVSITDRAGERKVEIANVAQRGETIRDLVNEEMKANGGDYDRAYGSVQKKNPALFAAMKQPALVK